MIEDKVFDSSNPEALAEALEQGENGFSFCRFRDVPINFLEGYRLDNCTFTNCNFAGQKVSDVHMKNCLFQACNMKGLVTSDLDLVDTDFHGCDMSYAALFGFTSVRGYMNRCKVDGMVMKGAVSDMRFANLSGRAYCDAVHFSSTDQKSPAEELREQARSLALAEANNLMIIGSNAASASYVLLHLKKVGVDCRNRLLAEVRKDPGKYGLTSDEEKLAFVVERTNNAVNKARDYLRKCRAFYLKHRNMQVTDVPLGYSENDQHIYALQHTGPKLLQKYVDDNAEKIYQRLVKEKDYDVTLTSEQNYANKSRLALMGTSDMNSQEADAVSRLHKKLADARLAEFQKKESKRVKLMHDLNFGKLKDAYQSYLGPADNTRKSDRVMQKNNDDIYDREQNKNNRDNEGYTMRDAEKPYLDAIDAARKKYVKAKKDWEEVYNKYSHDAPIVNEKNLAKQTAFEEFSRAKGHLAMLRNEHDKDELGPYDKAKNSLVLDIQNKQRTADAAYAAYQLSVQKNGEESQISRAQQVAYDNAQKFVKQAEARLDALEAEKEAYDERMKPFYDSELFQAHHGNLDYMGDVKVFGSKRQQNKEIYRREYAADARLKEEADAKEQVRQARLEGRTPPASALRILQKAKPKTFHEDKDVNIQERPLLYMKAIVPNEAPADKAKLFDLIDSLEQKQTSLLVSRSHALDTAVQNYLPDVKVSPDNLSLTANSVVINGVLGRYTVGQDKFVVSANCDVASGFCAYEIRGNMSIESQAKVKDMFAHSEFFNGLAVYQCDVNGKPRQRLYVNDASVKLDENPYEKPELDLTVDKKDNSNSIGSNIK